MIPFPAHWEKNPTKTMRPRRRRMPAVFFGQAGQPSPGTHLHLTAYFEKHADSVLLTLVVGVEPEKGDQQCIGE